MEMARRLEAMGVEKYAGLTPKTGKRTVWNGVVREDRNPLEFLHRWRKPRKIFVNRSEANTSELQSLMRNSYDVLCSNKKIHSLKPQSTITHNIPTEDLH